MGEPNYFDEILLVEDNPGDVRLTKEMLKEGGLNPTLHVVSDGSEALRFLHRDGEYRDAPRPDVILLDLHLPRLDGERVLEEMGNDVQDIPVIAISGSQEGAALKLNDLENEVAACLEKPINPDDLKKITKEL